MRGGEGCEQVRLTYQLVLAVKGGDGVEDGAAIALEGGGQLCALEIAGTGGVWMWRKEEGGGGDAYSRGPRS